MGYAHGGRVRGSGGRAGAPWVEHDHHHMRSWGTRLVMPATGAVQGRTREEGEWGKSEGIPPCEGDATRKL